jgi:hypothetical protein
MSFLTWKRLFAKPVSSVAPLNAGARGPAHYTENQAQTVVIAGEDCEVTVHRTGKTTFTAYGYVKGLPIEADADASHLAFSRWRHLAKMMRDA